MVRTKGEVHHVHLLERQLSSLNFANRPRASQTSFCLYDLRWARRCL